MTLTGPEADAKLMRIDDGVEFALRRAKVWSKYAKDVISYVEKRANLEAEHARNLLKLAQTMRPVLKEESFLPFQSIYCTAIDQDLDNANNCLSNCTLLHDHKFVEPLSARRNEHEKARKQLKEAWQRELKRMQELEANVRKARALYVQRHQEHDKAAQRADGDERRRRVEEDALQKAREAETTYKACVVEANERIAEVLQQVRELMCQCDQTMKAVTVAYFQLQHTVTAPAPIQFQTLCESSRLYEPGSQYLEFVRRIPAGRHPVEPRLLAFEPCAGDTRTESRRVHEAELEPLDQTALDVRLSSEVDRMLRGTTATSRPAGWAGGTSDSEGSNRSGDTSPAASPQALARTMLLTVSSGDELDTDHDNERAAGRPMCLSLAAETHSFRKLRTPSRCRECDSYVYFQGVECSECGLSSHKKCLETLAIRCGHKRLPRKMTTFGVELGGQPADEVPYIVRRCIAEMDARGYGVRGLYRVSGVKSKVERLCQCFENGATLVDLSDSPPHVVANVLKLYLRQLPEPLLTYRLYPHFIALAKEHPGGTSVPHHHHHPEEDEEDLGEDDKDEGDHHHDDEEEEAVVAALRSLVAQLPPLHARTLAALLRHLARVAAHSHLNQMPAGNLAIVFGPTLLRTSEGSASLSSLVDTVHQTRVIELLIMYVDRIFPDETPRHKQEPQVAEEHYTLLEAVTLRRCSSAGDVECTLPDEATTQSQDSDDAAEPVVLASQLTGGAAHHWCSGGGSEDAESEASDEGGLHQPPLANSGSSSSGGLDRPGAPSSASEDAAEPVAPVPPPRRSAARRVEARSCTRDTWSTTTSSSSQQSAQSKACNMAELRRQFFEAPWGGASLEELTAAGTRPSLLARHLLGTPARTSSEPQLPANDGSCRAGLSLSGSSRQTTSPHVTEARRRVHSPLRESVSLKKHWFSTDEASSSSSSCGPGGGDAGDAPLYYTANRKPAATKARVSTLVGRSCIPSRLIRSIFAECIRWHRPPCPLHHSDALAAPRIPSYGRLSTDGLALTNREELYVIVIALVVPRTGRTCVLTYCYHRDNMLERNGEETCLQIAASHGNAKVTIDLRAMDQRAAAGGITKADAPRSKWCQHHPVQHRCVRGVNQAVLLMKRENLYGIVLAQVVSNMKHTTAHTYHFADDSMLKQGPQDSHKYVAASSGIAQVVHVRESDGFSEDPLETAQLSC
ncbi:hypothetical protein MRX96_054748 [Rhipicephalus microplus]